MQRPPRVARGGAGPTRAATALAVLAVDCLLARPAAATEDWSLRLSAAAWGSGLDAETRVRGRRLVETDGGVFDDLDPVLNLDGELRWRRLGVLADVTVLDVGADAEAGPLAADLEVDGVLASLAGFWRAAEAERWSVDVLGGVRYWSIDTAFSLAGLGAAERSERWADPLIGARATVSVSERVTLQALGDVGGFGVGSDLQWEVVGRAAVALTDKVALAAGWRHLAFDYDKDDFALDATLTGPFLALDLSF